MSTGLVSGGPAEAPAQGWTLGGPPSDYVLGHVRAVLPDQVLDDALVAVRDGRIAAVEPHPAGVEADVDGQGMLCLPGLVDVHSDGLEKEQLPRPGAELPLEFALLSFEGKLRAAGVTTAFHGAAFEESGGRGMRRTLENARRICAAVASRGDDGLVDHRILHRLDVRCPEGLAGLRQRLEEIGGTAGGPLLVSHEDHTPGQGQYADRGYYERYLMGTRGVTEEEARAYVDRLIEDRDGRLDVREEALGWLGEQARAGRIRLLGHDPGSPEEVEELCDRGGAVAEFPTTAEAAKSAREHAMPVVMGAPNVLRGHSHNGNASGRELVGRGLVTALASDYLPSGLLGAALLLAEEGLTTLPAAVGLVTGGAAYVAGLHDRGRLEAGLRADLVLAEPGRPWPVVAAVLRAGSGGEAA
ncbi:alpha-D-ribose 1-methylphosphonate 5-triphosphate diphosphatase [Streptomyces samsunensis]|uniref:Alpha-D-ribose 1-methylphosphonate 5-triphosphate diphosphatase n=3 Tax=Streptomyces malaysiensis TaxID=92644 RepID=A0A2J7Z333_STRMQ|nr:MULTISPECIES: alpha-D-ribose 1-methylphosphonate 5-triphosphate diphosphatase [Streptomyces]AUA16410.1 Alpha-D-ribose 1-methylphosphonate 5-triphosphate diphosphatase [Streptomyces sp. M56]MCD9586321.1 alpha-D-ribose 1-methylphosphonate 5-triphosphate diphosphatase [Streptomyces sp. 8ZJF_21]MYX60578.1 alpha-D-ribose 1-methylphosphonate 5-triphosphate diphosphatase [Streptomyces sp. SID8382]NUH35944.1 alpha-D-ribose 1-methylphosphonate 5-triphosphate diphosphatase [Streptomyces samsunensis]P